MRSLSRWSGALAILAASAAFGFGPTPVDDSLAKLTVQSFPKPIPVPVVALAGIDGAPLRLDELRGKMVFLNFWATWCVPCRQEMPAMERLYRAYEKRGLAVVAVNFGESKADVLKFLSAQPPSFAIALDPAGEAASSLGVRGLPVSWLLDRDGRILWKAIGSREWDSAAGQAYFDKLLPPARQ